MIEVDLPTAEFVTRVLRESNHPEAPLAAKKMLCAAIETQVREIEFDEPPAFLRRQAD